MRSYLESDGKVAGLATPDAALDELLIAHLRVGCDTAIALEAGLKKHVLTLCLHLSFLLSFPVLSDYQEKRVKKGFLQNIADILSGSCGTVMACN